MIHLENVGQSRKRRGAVSVDDQTRKSQILALCRKDGLDKLHRLFLFVVVVRRCLKTLRQRVSARKSDSSLQPLPSVPETFLQLQKKIFNVYRPCFFIFLLALIVFSGLFLVAWDLLLGFWSKDILNFGNRLIYFYSLIGLTVFISLYIFVRDYVIFKISANIAESLFIESLNKVVSADQRWFEKFTPKTVVYRLTNDLVVFENDFYRSFYMFNFNITMGVIGVVIVNIVFPGVFLIPSIFGVWFFIRCIRRYLKTVRIFMKEWYVRRPVWYNVYELTQDNILSLRQISKQQYFWKYFHPSQL